MTENQNKVITKFEDKQKFNKEIANWLKPYVDSVVKRVIKYKLTEILENQTACMMLRELYDREQKELNDFETSVENLINHFNEYEQFDIRSNCLTHSIAYREVLYDMYIRNLNAED